MKVYTDKKLSGEPTAAMVTGRNKIGEVTKRLAAMGIPKAAWPNGWCFNKGYLYTMLSLKGIYIYDVVYKGCHLQSSSFFKSDHLQR